MPCGGTTPIAAGATGCGPGAPAPGPAAWPAVTSFAAAAPFSSGRGRGRRRPVRRGWARCRALVGARARPAPPGRPRLVLLLIGAVLCGEPGGYGTVLRAARVRPRSAPRSDPRRALRLALRSAGAGGAVRVAVRAAARGVRGRARSVAGGALSLRTVRTVGAPGRRLGVGL